MKKEKKIMFLKKLVFYYTLLFSIVLFVVFSVALFLYSYYSNRTRVLNEQIIANESLKQLDSYMGQLENKALQISTNPLIVNYFTEYKNNNVSEDYFDTNILSYLEIYTIIKNINGGVNPSWRISAYNQKGNFVSAGTQTDKIQVRSEFKKADVANIISIFKNTKVPFLTVSPIDDKWSNYYSSKYISFFKPIKNEYSEDVLGLVEIQENIETLKDYLKIGHDNLFAINVYDGGNRTIINSDNKNMIKVDRIKSSTYGFTIDLLESKNNLHYGRNTFICSLIFLFVLLIITMHTMINKIARNLSKPVIELKDIVTAINISNVLEIGKSEIKIDEISELQNAFEVLLKNLMIAHEQEKKAIFHAIQAQMNPHFLYNTLSVINAIAIENEDYKIVKMCENISNMLRYVSNYSEETVMFQDEINHTLCYLDLMKERYGDMFSTDLLIDGNIDVLKVPKLVLQPIVENCFFHAFNNIEPPYEINLFIKVIDEKNYKISVIDNGSGFSNERKEEIMKDCNLNSNINIKNAKIGGIGILSSVERLKLFTGLEVCCKITDNEPKGSIVSIIVGQVL